MSGSNALFEALTNQVDAVIVNEETQQTDGSISPHTIGWFFTIWHLGEFGTGAGAEDFLMDALLKDRAVGYREKVADRTDLRDLIASYNRASNKWNWITALQALCDLARRRDTAGPYLGRLRTRLGFLAALAKAE